MNQRELGKSGLIVSAIGLGCMGMSQSYGPGDETESVRTLNRALDIGVTFFDTAAVYGLGANERLLNRVLATRRAEVVLATKCGIVRGADGKPSALDGSPAEITRSCDQSLERLGIDVIDLFYLHRVDPKVPIEESVGAMASAGARRQSSLPGTLGSRSLDAQARPRRSPDHRTPERIFPLVAGAGGQRFAGLSRAGHRFRSLQSAWPWIPLRNGDRHGRAVE